MTKTKILAKVNNRQEAMTWLRDQLMREGILIDNFDMYYGILETKHVLVRHIKYPEALHGLYNYDIAFDFEDSFNVDRCLKTGHDTYSGSILGYIIKTEAEWNILDAQSEIKRNQRLLINSTYGVGKSKFTEEFVKYGEAVAEGYKRGLGVDIDDAIAQYCRYDVEITNKAIAALGRFHIKSSLDVDVRKFIKKIVFNDPATIIFWTDDTKTVVKAENEPFDPEKGMAMAIAKKVLGNKHDYYNTFVKWMKKYKPEESSNEPRTDVGKPESIHEHDHLQDCLQNAYKTLINTQIKPTTKRDIESAVNEALGYIVEVLEG